MLYFESDYTEGAHPKILERLIQTNMESLSGYGADRYSQSAADKIRAACACPHADVRFLVGGTQTNRVIIGSMLGDCEGVIAASTGHVSLHEAGAIEATGHKVITLPERDGKLEPQTVADYLARFYADGNREHMVFPGMVYISHPTEYGTLYSKSELTALSDICHRYGIPLFLDGARLGYGLMSDESDLTLPDIAALCDVFYIGGTKVGALCGEAVVFTKRNTPKHFQTVVKQHGALLAKGRLLGIQFDTLFTDGLYFQISRHAIEMAKQLKQILIDAGFRLYLDSPTNQQFPILENEEMQRLRKLIAFSFWEAYDESHSIVRLATSWATTEEQLCALRNILSENK